MSDQERSEPPGPTSGPQPYGQPHAPQPYGQHYGQPYSQPYGQPGLGQPGHGDPDKRPGTVTAAGVITLVSAGLSLGVFVIVLVVTLLTPDAMAEEIRATEGLQGMAIEDISVLVAVMMAVLALWCVGAMVLAVFAMRRANGARIGLVVSAALSALMSLLAITSVISAVPLLASIAVIICLFVGGANPWYAHRDGGGRLGMARPPVA